MKKIFLLLTITMTYSMAECQLDKGVWLVGGSGKFYSYNESNSSSTLGHDAKYTQIDISPSIGYFVADKLAFGLRPTLSSIKGGYIADGGGITTNVQRFWVGPFGRYYFLNTEKQYNIVTDVCYQLGFFGGGLLKGNLSTFSALAGPEIFFNSSVGIEFLLGYNYRKEDVEDGNKDIKKGFQVAVGFQIHLEKN
jgi:hypothetical protein